MTMPTHGRDPAFPVNGSDPDFYQGLTKREYFAAAALQGLLAAPSLSCWETEHFTRKAIKLADALIEELNK